MVYTRIHTNSGKIFYEMDVRRLIFMSRFSARKGIACISPKRLEIVQIYAHIGTSVRVCVWTRNQLMERIGIQFAILAFIEKVIEENGMRVI
jgi:hypothetical protein